MPVLLYVLCTAKGQRAARLPLPCARRLGTTSSRTCSGRGGADLADAEARVPVIVYSGGYNAHSLAPAHLKTLASHGYVVVDIFTGDARAPGCAGRWRCGGGLQAATDFILTDPAFAGHVDAERVGASGTSAGEQRTIPVDDGRRAARRQRPSLLDARIKAGFGTITVTGTSFGVWPMQVDAWFFGLKDYAGLQT